MAETVIDLIGVGSPIVDTLAHVSEDFVAGIGGAKGGMELVNAQQQAELLASLQSETKNAPGGSAGNTAFAAARLGLRTTFLGKLGNDEAAKIYRDGFAQAGGDTSRFKVGDVPNARCLSLITPDSERTMRTDLGAAMTLMPEELSAEDFAGCRHAHIEGYLLFNQALMRRVLDCAKAAGCTISLDLASFEVVNAARDILGDLLENDIDCVFANEDEATAWFGKTLDYPAMAKRFAETCRVGVVKVGKDGSYVASEGKVEFIEPVVVNQVVDTTGAGDFWAGGFLTGWLSGKPLTTCGHYGSVLGAEVVQILGATLPESRWADLRQQLA